MVVRADTAAGRAPYPLELSILCHVSITIRYVLSINLLTEALYDTRCKLGISTNKMGVFGG